MQEFTLKEVQLRLGVPQHVLIHLCEKGVISPEIQDAEGRGRWRQFSERNLFEFALALELRKYQIPVAFVEAIIKLLSSFERSVRQTLKDFALPPSIAGKSPRLLLYLYGGEYLVFSVGKDVLLGFDVGKIVRGDVKGVKTQKLNTLPSDYASCLEIDLNEIALAVAI